VPDRDLNDMLRRWAGCQPSALAFVTAERTWTFAEVHEATSRIAQGLAGPRQCAEGDRVACLTRHHVIEMRAADCWPPARSAPSACP
jgi:acyl-coenzyme A synthetase/AMP-(fatty) acid ligase